MTTINDATLTVIEKTLRRHESSIGMSFELIEKLSDDLREQRKNITLIYDQMMNTLLSISSRDN